MKKKQRRRKARKGKSWKKTVSKRINKRVLIVASVGDRVVIY